MLDRSEALISHGRPKLGTRGEVPTGHQGSNVKHEKESPNILRRTRCLIIVKSQRLKVDQILGKRSPSGLKSTGY